jgi:hypothetical protein
VLPSPENRIDRGRKITWKAAYLGIVTSGLCLLFSGWFYDDPFITYRYAANLSNGLGFVYNAGERVLSTTTPFFVLLLGVVHPLWSDLHSFAILIGAFSLAVGGLFLWDLADTPDTHFTRWTGLLFYPFFPLVAKTLSSETPLYLALCLGAFACYRRQRYLLTALCAALAVLTRPDGLLVAGILSVHFSLTHFPLRRLLSCIPWKGVLLFCGLVLSWIGFAWFYFGSPIPVTLYAKQQQAFVDAGIAFLPSFLTILRQQKAWPYLLEALIAIPGLLFGLRRLPTMRWLAVWTCLYFTSYALVGVTHYFWYYAPLVPAFVLAVGLGIDRLQALLRRLANRLFHLTTRYFPTMLLVLLLLVQIQTLWQARLSPDLRFPIYHAIGQWLKLHSVPEASVGTLEVGIIGYYAQQPMIDFAGLIQPEIAVQLGQTGSYSAAASWAITHYQPAYIVLQQDLFPDLESELLIPHCELLITFPGAEYRYTYDMVIYSCP